MQSNAQNYYNWLHAGGFRAKAFALTFIDIDIMVLQVLNAYKCTTYTYDFQKQLEDFFISHYTHISKGERYYKPGCISYGEKAFNYLKTPSDWNSYGYDMEFMDLFNRCILFEFKNHKQIKNMFKMGV